MPLEYNDIEASVINNGGVSKKKNDFFMEKHVNLDDWASRFAQR